MVLPQNSPAVRTDRNPLLGIALGVTGLAALLCGVVWPVPAGGGRNFTHADIMPIRDFWWGLVVATAVVGIVALTLQALAIITLVRGRGRGLAQLGGGLVWIGATVQGVGAGGWASTYFHATDPGVEPAAGQAVIEAANRDPFHLFGLLVIGILLVTVGTILQCIALFRSRVVPRWIPVSALFTIILLFLPGGGVISLTASLPMAAAALGLGYYVWRGLDEAVS